MKLKVYALLITVMVLCLSFYIYKNQDDRKIKTELYFGLSGPEGPVTDVQWEAFREEKLERILDGFTEIRGRGFWKGHKGKSYNEDSMIIIYIHEESASENRKIDSVIQLYKTEFKQESVLKTQQEIKAYF